MVDDLTKKKCVPCEGDTKPLTSLEREFNIYHEQVPDWEIIDQEKKLKKKFKFKDFKEALAFVNKVGEIAESENHHPNICLYSWNKVKITLTTHAIGGLSINDFILAYRISQIK